MIREVEKMKRNTILAGIFAVLGTTIISTSCTNEDLTNCMTGCFQYMCDNIDCSAICENACDNIFENISANCPTFLRGCFYRACGLKSQRDLNEGIDYEKLKMYVTAIDNQTTPGNFYMLVRVSWTMRKFYAEPTIKFNVYYQDTLLGSGKVVGDSDTMGGMWRDCTVTVNALPTDNLEEYRVELVSFTGVVS
jgi:hypothetical protein